MKRENQEFYGILRDKELYLIEDALNGYKTLFSDEEGDNPEMELKIDSLVQKLYSEFAELPPNCEIVFRKKPKTLHKAITQK